MLNFNEIKKHEEYKQLCIASYKPYEKGYVEGYKLIAAFPNERTGFFACVYKKENEVVLVYRGTDWDNLKDIKNDLQMGIKKQAPEQKQDAFDTYYKISQICKENGWNLTVAGHSLGGSLAMMVGAITGVTAVTFNAYGVKNLLSPSVNFKSDNITNYCNPDDRITSSNAENHIGKCYSIRSTSLFKKHHLLESMDSLYTREETKGFFLQDQYEQEEKEKKSFQEYMNNGKKHIIRMPGLYSDIADNSECSGSYPVSGYTKKDGTKVDSYERKCYLHGN